MEIKYTLEILTKDIQDIEKLVGNLQNSPEGSTLELDLALSKLRNVYDILSVIRTDKALEAASPDRQARSSAVKEEPVADNQEPMVEEKETVAVEKEPEATEKETEVVEKEPEATEKEPEAVEKEPEATEKEPEAVEKEPGATEKEPEAAALEPAVEILAEKFEAESSINENLAGNRDQEMDSKVIGEPIESISRNIGINDRFLIIRELFGGDSDGFGALIENLDNAGDLKSANQILEKQFEQVPDHEGISILANLIKRRYNRD